ncbi:MAG: hypothetical protein ACTHMY_29645 [Solirubrobacteraceae bacterium]
MFGTVRGRSIGAALAAAALAGGVAACGGSSSSGSATNAAAPATASSATTAASATTTAATTTSGSSSSALAKPGTKLSIGQSAKVGYNPAGSTDKAKASTLQVTVQSFDKGTLSDFNGIQLDANEKASTPVYVKVHVTNLGPASVDVDGTAAAIEGVDNTGNNQSSVTFIGDFPKCPDSASTKPIATGSGYDDCLTFLVPGGITKVSYNGTNDYIDSPVTWAPN